MFTFSHSFREHRELSFEGDAPKPEAMPEQQRVMEGQDQKPQNQDLVLNMSQRMNAGNAALERARGRVEQTEAGVKPASITGIKGPDQKKGDDQKAPTEAEKKPTPPAGSEGKPEPSDQNKEKKPAQAPGGKTVEQGQGLNNGKSVELLLGDETKTKLAYYFGSPVQDLNVDVTGIGSNVLLSNPPKYDVECTLSVPGSDKGIVVHVRATRSDEEITGGRLSESLQKSGVLKEGQSFFAEASLTTGPYTYHTTGPLDETIASQLNNPQIVAIERRAASPLPDAKAVVKEGEKAKEGEQISAMPREKGQPQEGVKPEETSEQKFSVQEVQESVQKEFEQGYKNSPAASRRDWAKDIVRIDVIMEGGRTLIKPVYKAGSRAETIARWAASKGRELVAVPVTVDASKSSPLDAGTYNALLDLKIDYSIVEDNYDRDPSVKQEQNKEREERLKKALGSALKEVKGEKKYEGWANEIKGVSLQMPRNETEGRTFGIKLDFDKEGNIQKKLAELGNDAKREKYTTWDAKVIPGAGEEKQAQEAFSSALSNLYDKYKEDFPPKEQKK